MGNFLWYLTPKREALLKKLEELPEYGKMRKSNLVELALQEFIKEHGDSQNPQTKMDLFENKLIMAIPNIYADPSKFENFYNLIKKKEEYEELDAKLNSILQIHNEHLKRF